MQADTARRPSRLRRGSVLTALAAAVALVMSAIVPSIANAAPPTAGTYEGTSTAWNGAPLPPGVYFQIALSRRAM